MPVYQNIDFNPANWAGGAADVIAFAKKFWTVMNGGVMDDTLSAHLSPENLHHPRFVNDGANSHLSFKFAATPDLVEVAGAYATQALMFADPAPPPNGTLVNCSDPDSAKRGVYERNGAAPNGWTVYAPNIADKAWNDYNHPQWLLEILIASFIKTLAGPGVIPNYMGAQQGWEGPTAGAISDWRNVRMTLGLRAINLWLGQFAKIPIHIQGNVPDRAAALTAAYGGTKYFVPNFIKTTQLISDQLGFGNDSWGKPNAVPVVRDSARRNVVLDLVPDDSEWECLGDSGRDPAVHDVNYGAASIADVLQNVQGNAYIMTVHPNPKEGANWFTISSADRIPDHERTAGEVRLYSIRIETL